MMLRFNIKERHIFWLGNDAVDERVSFVKVLFVCKYLWVRRYLSGVFGSLEGKSKNKSDSLRIVRVIYFWCRHTFFFSFDRACLCRSACAICAIALPILNKNMNTNKRPTAPRIPATAAMLNTTNPKQALMKS